jgi:nucleoside-diphosphate-sugar epimerase
MKRYLVTAVAGFIGNKVAERLLAGAECFGQSADSRRAGLRMKY